ncbi:hypothetical protein R3P38DRAFT_3321745 [Favolaschia claudopus]|uniref:Cyclin-D1-binding protein 1 n=1 Tax=Favolaschia claudopus TaxID=2862362 RepID=A0AAW0AQG6_9AGAR
MPHSNQKVLLSLRLVLDTCNAALDPAAVPPEPASESVQVLRKDLVSLMSLLYAATTKVSLALKPSKPTYSAALAPLKDLSDHVSALFHCANLFVPHIQGATLVREVHSLVRDAIESIKALSQTFLEIEASDSRQGSGQAGDEYMVRTATVHSVLDKARALSPDNVAAVRKQWKEDAASLEDGFREVGDMIDEEESEADVQDDDDFDDGWGGIGIGKSQKMTLEERDRTKKIHGILRLSQLLHKRILRDHLLPSPPLDNPTLDALAISSRQLLSASDDLVATLYTPQDPKRMETELAAFRKIISNFQASLSGANATPDAVATQIASLSLTKAANQESLKWFDTCFVQLFKAVEILDDILRQT